MEFLESTDFFLRITVYDLKHKDESVKLKFRLIPMFHIGEKIFYDQVKEKLYECHELIYEGIQGNINKRFLNIRKTLADNLNLVVQRETLSLKGLDIKFTHGDYTAEESQKAWRKVKLFNRVKERFIDPIQSYFFNKNMTRKKLAKYFMKSYEDSYLAYGPRHDEIGTVANYRLAEREKILLKIVNQRFKEESNEDKLIAILYGAGHMGRISRYIIDKKGYTISKGEFITVFNIT